jgi:hypothetical protein
VAKVKVCANALLLLKKIKEKWSKNGQKSPKDVTKISKSRKQFMVFSILPKKNGRIENTIIFFRDLLTFSVKKIITKIVAKIVTKYFLKYHHKNRRKNCSKSEGLCEHFIAPKKNMREIRT